MEFKTQNTLQRNTTPTYIPNNHPRDTLTHTTGLPVWLPPPPEILTFTIDFESGETRRDSQKESWDVRTSPLEAPLISPLTKLEMRLAISFGVQRGDHGMSA
jgi:hypothetical protein